MGFKRLVKALLTWIFLAACGGGDLVTAQEAPAAGEVEVGEKESGVSRPIILWRLDPDPEVTIGAWDGPDEVVLPNIIKGTVLSDGTIVVALFLQNFFELRYFDQNGDFLARAGRFGKGPFEVSQYGLNCAQRLPGDSIFVVGVDTRFHLFGPRGEKVRSGKLPLYAISMNSYYMDEGHLVVQELRDGPEGPEAPHTAFKVLDLKSGEISPVATYPFDRTLSLDGLAFEVPFAARPYGDAGAGRFWYGYSDKGEIYSVSFGGEPPDTIRTGAPRVSVSREHRKLYEEIDYEYWSGIHPSGRMPIVSRHHRRVEYPDSFPAFQGIQVAEDGNVWILRYEPRWSQEDYIWDVFDPSGTRLGSAIFPFDAISRCFRTWPFGGCSWKTILEIGDDYVLTAHRDELSVQRIKKFRLLKGSVRPERR